MRQLPKDLFVQSERDRGHPSFDQTPCGAAINFHPSRHCPRTPDRSPHEDARSPEGHSSKLGFLPSRAGQDRNKTASCCAGGRQGGECVEGEVRTASHRRPNAVRSSPMKVLLLRRGTLTDGRKIPNSLAVSDCACKAIIGQSNPRCRRQAASRTSERRCSL
jgi:hypothetical protein